MALKLTAQLKCDNCGKVLKFDAKMLKARRRRSSEPIIRLLGIYIIGHSESGLQIWCDPLAWEMDFEGTQFACSKKCALALIETRFDAAMKEIRSQHEDEDKS